MWITTRATVSDPWDTPVNLGSIVNSSSHEESPKLSADGSNLYFNSNRPGGYGGQWGDIWQAPIIPIVDFTGDGVVDAHEICIMVDHWGEDYSSCDIGPTPLGDGIIDVKDLKVLAGHLFEDVTDPTLIAHWPLDEVQGDIAYNDAAELDGTLIGDPIWRPDLGVVAGALQFDGVDDHVETDPILNPADGVFSVIAWIQGGAPGQVVLSQELAANWLMLDAEGKLMTELKSSARSAGGPLLSEAVITDVYWHRIGFVWDGSYRHLHVDGVEVARDDTPQPDLKGSGGSLYLGAGSTLAPGTFFSGLIDDVRIYNRAVRP